MFNAIFGNFLFSTNNRGTENQETVDHVGSAVESVKNNKAIVEASTQTTSIGLEFNGKLGVGSNDDKNALSTDKIATSTKTATVGNNNPLDWVLIDPSEGNMSVDMSNAMDESLIEKPNQLDNLVEMGCNTDPMTENKENMDEDNNNDVLLGSFFDKNEHEDTTNGQLLISNLFRSGLGLNEIYNECDNEEQSKQQYEEVVLPARKDETWLITPLPCLTSITESSHQRSMIDNYPLENLLIEHPSMSVFISATNANSNTTQQDDDDLEEENKSLPVATPNRQQKLSQSVSLPLISISNQIEVTQLDDICCEMTTVKSIESTCIVNKTSMKKKNKKANKKNNRKPNRTVPRRSVTFNAAATTMKQESIELEPIIFTIGDEVEDCDEQTEEQAQPQPEVVMATTTTVENQEVVELEPVAEILEATVLQQVAVVEQQIESANLAMNKKTKKSKKTRKSKQQQQQNSPSNNKENMQVKTLLLNDMKKSCSPQANHNRFELSLLNKNQMKRNNKNSTFSALRNNINSQQRKYHKLQQPSFSVNIQQF
jgi:hypothetical protein